MSARVACALLLLAAVFSMHGVQCAAAHGEAGHGSMPAVTAAGEGLLYEAGGDAAAGPAVHGAVAAHAGGTALAVGTRLSDVGLPLHDATFWAVCLAIVLGGTLLLGVIVLVRKALGDSVRARAGLRTSGRLWRTGWCRLPRPPDLAALCLLQI